MVQLTDSLFAVEVPEEAEHTQSHESWGTIISYWVKGKWYDMELQGSYTILGTIKQGKPDFDVVPYCIDTWDSFGKIDNHFLSLLTSKNLDTKKHWLILKTK